LHQGELQARTAEELMRSRYSAYAYGDAGYLFRTWHPRTRPVDVTVDPGITWTGLQVIDAVAGGPDDDRGEVEFRALSSPGAAPTACTSAVASSAAPADGFTSTR
jgi:SEC-C motif-containing protein